MLEVESNVIIADGELRWMPESIRPEAIIGIAVISGSCTLFAQQREQTIPACTCLFVRADAVEAVQADRVQAVLWVTASCGDEALAMNTSLRLREIDVMILHDVFFEDIRPLSHQQAALRLILHQLLACRAVHVEAQQEGDRLVDAIHSYLLEHLDEPLSLDRLSREFGYSKVHILRCYRQATKQSPMQHLAELRLVRAKELLRQTELSISQVAHSVGYASLASFSHFFRRHEKRSPSQYRENCRWLI